MTCSIHLTPPSYGFSRHQFLKLCFSEAVSWHPHECSNAWKQKFLHALPSMYLQPWCHATLVMLLTPHFTHILLLHTPDASKYWPARKQHLEAHELLCSATPNPTLKVYYCESNHWITMNQEEKKHALQRKNAITAACVQIGTVLVVSRLDFVSN